MSISRSEATLRNGHAQWRHAVAAVLAKARRTEVSELPAEPENLLNTDTYDGVTIAPLYTGLDELLEPSLPGQWPFTRGADPHRDVTSGWKVSERYGAQTDGASADPAAVNELILAGLENGVSALWLTVGELGVAPQDLDKVLDGVFLDLAPLTLAAGRSIAEAAQKVFERLDSVGRSGNALSNPDGVRVMLGATTLTDQFCNRSSVEMSVVVELAKQSSARKEEIRAITVDGLVFHEAGASDAQELGAAIAAGVQYLRELTDAGLSVSEALEQCEFRFAATDEQFHTIAKFRAARKLWGRIAQVCGEPESGNAPTHAVTSGPMMSQRDPWVNMLRTTLAAFGAGVGGADRITVLPFDSALVGGMPGVSRSFADRMARNTQLLLLEESHIARVLDPAGGSWYVEDLTESLAAAAWAFFQEIERVGGYSSALQRGIIADGISETKVTRQADIAYRRKAITGVNEFPNLAEDPLDLRDKITGYRYAEDFEGLRDRSDAHLARTGSRPTALLIPLGPIAEHNIRTTFASNLLAAGGIDVINPGTLEPTSADFTSTIASHGASLCVVCGSDKSYAIQAQAAIVAARAAGISTVLLAGAKEAQGDLFSNSDTIAPDQFLTAKINAVEVLSQLLASFGA
ncbi:MAG: methylmalonyl-CoA mutase family protein [Mycobacteriaceae bacterium]